MRGDVQTLEALRSATTCATAAKMRFAASRTGVLVATGLYDITAGLERARPGMQAAATDRLWRRALLRLQWGAFSAHYALTGRPWIPIGLYLAER